MSQYEDGAAPAQRITITVPGPLLEAVKEEAATHGDSVSALFVRGVTPIATRRRDLAEVRTWWPDLHDEPDYVDARARALASLGLDPEQQHAA